MEEERLEIGQTFGFAIETIGARTLPFAVLVLVIGGLDGLRDTYAANAIRDGSVLASRLPLALSFSAILSAVLTFVTAVLATFYALKVRCGDELVVTLAFGRAIGVYVLSGLAIMVGLVLLIVPGIYLMLIWSLAVPALMAEDLSISDSLGRSMALTEGHRATVLGIILMVSLPMMIFGWGIGALGQTFFGAGIQSSLAYHIGVDVVTAGASVLSTVLIAEAYITLSGQRNRLGALREIFA